MSPLSRIPLACVREGFLGLMLLLGAASSLPAAQDLESGALFSGHEIPHLAIEISELDLEILRGAKARMSRDAVRTNVLVTIREGDCLYTNVSLHLKGSGSFQAVDKKPNFTLDFHDDAPKQRFHGLQKISLNNSTHDHTFMCEILGREMFAAAGIPAPRATHATVSLNGRELGVYVLLEGWNKQFLKRHFPDATGNLYERSILSREMTRKLDVISGDRRDDHRALEALIAAAGEPDLKKRRLALESTLDLDGFIRFMAVEMMLNHWDGYSRNNSNYRAFHERKQDRIVFLSHGLDYLFRVRLDGPELSVMSPMQSLVASAVMDMEAERLRYVTEVARLHESIFDVTAMTNRIHEIQVRLRPLLATNTVASNNFQQGVEKLLYRIPERHEAIRQQLVLLRTPWRPVGRDKIDSTMWGFKRTFGNIYSTKQDYDHRPVLAMYGNRGSSETNHAGGWRATHLLAPGRYRFEGRAIATNDVPCGEIGLRTSESNELVSIPAPNTWTNLTHDFTVTTNRLVDLICEYRGEKPQRPFRVCFEVNSLTLTRLPDPLTPPADARRGKLSSP